MKIEQFLREKITEGSAGRPVYPVFAPEYQQLPFVVYQRTGTSRERVLPQSAGNPIATFMIVVYSSTYTESREIADNIRQKLDNFTGVYGQEDNTVNVLFSHVSDESDGEPVQFDGESKPAYSANLLFNIKYEEEC